jgi:hypothetical protein
MAFVHGKTTKVLVGKYDMSAFFNEATSSRSVETGETTTFTKTAKTYIVGLQDATASFSGMFDGDASATDDVLNQQLALDAGTVITFGVNGFAYGARTQMMKSKATSYEVSSPVGDVVSVTAEFQADDGIQSGVSLHQGADTATGFGTGVDNGASTANGGSANLHVTANTMNAGTLIKVQHSSDNSTFTDLGSFTSVGSSTITSENISVAAGTTVNRYLRVSTTASGTGSITFHVSFGRK